MSRACRSHARGQTGIRLASVGFAALALAALALLAGGQASGSDGVNEINQTSALAGDVTAGDQPGFPVEIFTGGSFILTSDLVVPPAAEAGINVYATGTRIDLNGFTISSTTQCSGQPPVCSPAGNGVGINASGATDVRIRNGRIAGFGYNGISIFEEGAISDVTIESNGLGGIAADEGCLITDNIVRRNGGIGIQAGTGSRIAANVVTRNAGLGISAPLTAVVQNNAVSLNVGSGAAGARFRRFYMTKSTGGLGNQALTACSAGFHMASTWELLELSTLTYDTELGQLQADSGSGPPTTTNLGSAGFAWIRTGAPASAAGSNTPGFDNCRAWTSASSGDQGTAAALVRTGANPTSPTWPWALVTIPCNQGLFVWCVED